MKISYIIPYYNEPSWMLSECVKSILNINIDGLEKELIVVNDGSDNSPEQIVKSIDNNIICIDQDNQGPGAARNNGMNVATGDYIQFVDSDDVLLPDYALCAQMILSKQSDVCFFRTYPTSSYLIETSADDYLQNHNLRGAACGLLFKRDIVGDLQFDVTIINEDELFNVQLLLRAKSVIDMGIHAYYYRKHGDSRSHSTDMKRINRRLDDILTIILRLKSMMDNGGNMVLYRKVTMLTMDYMYNAITLTRSYGEYRKRRKELKKMRLHPLPLVYFNWKYYLFALITRFF